MTREEQDKNWDNLSQENKEEMKDKYAEFSAKGTPESKGYCQGLANVFGEHNLNPVPTYEDILKWGNGKDLKSLYKKLEAIGDLMLVAKFLNKNEDGSDWVADFSDVNQKKWYIDIDYNIDRKGKIKIDWKIQFQSEIVYFRTKEIAEQAVRILGEDVIRTALSNDY